MAAVVTSDRPTAEAPKVSMTSKEWIIPPRPKPGRKPATDMPLTKRKAQNRAAQRAFRERRAARVGELEQQLEEQLEAHDKHEAELKDKIHGLELDLQSFRSRCMLLENMLERIRAETLAETFKQQGSDVFFRAPAISDPAGQARIQQHGASRPPLRHATADGRQFEHANSKNFSISQIVTPKDALAVDPQQHDDTHFPLTCGHCSPSGPCSCAEQVLASATGGCGKCEFGSPCQCVDGMAGAADLTPDLKRPASPSDLAPSEKRHRSTASAVEATSSVGKSYADKTPYTTLPASERQMPSGDSMPLKDRCGFCKEGTYCMCAEDAAMATPAPTATAEALPPMLPQTQTPPPSEPDSLSPPLVMEMTADGSVKLPRRARAPPHEKPTKANPGSCGVNRPGTCAQCQADPKSGLFCRLMAAKFDRDQGGTGGPGGCCGAKGGAGCCKAGPGGEKITLPSLPSLGLSCAEAYQTLSSHRNFDRAADDIGSWLPKLKATTPSRGPDSQHQGRHAVEVEAASIMSVLKEFDVRFGREC